MKKKLLIILLLGLISISLTGCLPMLFPEPNNEPIITSAPVTTASVGVAYTYNVDATDIDGDVLTYTLTNPPAGMNINPSNGVISWIPIEEGDYPITVTVSDGKLTDTQSFTITVSLGATTSGRVVMAELFVAPACTRCPKAKGYMAQLLQEYGFEKLVVLEEYAWDYPLSSGWATSETTGRYYHLYLDYLGIKGATPDAYFNGLNQFVHHGDDTYSNYKAAIEAELAKAPKVSISASCSVTGSIVSISGQISNISLETLSNIVIEAMIYEDSVALVIPDYKIDDIVNHVVRDIVTYEESGELIDSFAPGESHEFSLTSSSLSNVHNMSNIHIVVYVQAPNSSTKEILQALYVE